ncbi:MAG: alpha/beta fold hydrolase [Acidimicrobiales bacterium]
MTKEDQSAGARLRDKLPSGKGAAAVAVAGALGAAGIGYAARRAARRRAAGRDASSGLGLAGLAEELDLPAGTRHLDIPVRDGGNIHVADWGEGPPIVLLHGLTLQSSVWAYQFRDLGDRHRMIALDLRGHGHSEPGEAGMTIAAMADDLADVLEALDLRRATVVGHSMGGMATLRFCRRHPGVVAERVGAIAIIASSGGISIPLETLRRLVPMAVDLVVAGHGAVNRSGRPLLPSNSAGTRGTLFVFGEHPDPVAVRRTLEYSRAMRPDRLVSLLSELVNFNERERLGHAPVPCLVVVGDRDRLTPPKYGRALVETLPGARLVVLPGAGHMLMYERREAIVWLLDQLSAEAEGKGAVVVPE